MKKKAAAPERVAFLAQLSQSAPTPELGKLYGMAMSAVARKTVIRLDRDTKARFCKKCFVPRSPLTTQWRIEDLSRKQNRPMLITKCQCGHTVRRSLNNEPPKN